MFKVGSFEAEIAKSMSDNLSGQKLEKQASLQRTAHVLKLGQAVDHLDAAATIFEAAGFTTAAETLTRVLETLANSKKQHEGHDQDLPEVFEIESLLHDEPKDEEDDLGEQVIEMRSIAKKKV